MSEVLSDWLGFVGRLHPLLLHLPIGFITLLAVIEAVAGWARFQETAAARRLVLHLSVISVAVTAGCGWILSWGDGYAEETLAWHKWLGTALVPMVMVLQILPGRCAIKAYRIWLGLTMVLLVATGHYGNTLVRGADYLFPTTRMSSARADEVLPGNTVAGERPAPTAFVLLVQPILKEYCIGCHGAEKSKGKLRLDTTENLLKGGESGLVIRPGSAAQSLLVKRLRLPQQEDEHMPPADRKQPGAREIVLLELWINAGAPVHQAINEPKMLEIK